jgi:hypothetical protein
MCITIDLSFDVCLEVKLKYDFNLLASCIKFSN